MQDRVKATFGGHRSIENARRAATEMSQRRVDVEQTMEEVRELQRRRSWRQDAAAARGPGASPDGRPSGTT
jgi:hypothetical protein